MSNQVEHQTSGTFEISRDRFLEYTDNTLSVQLQALSSEAVDCLQSWPCILMQEGRGEEAAYIAQSAAVSETGADVKISIQSYPCDPPILNDTLWRLRADLDIGGFEFGRNHWAVKDRNLFSVLSSAGVTVDDKVASKFKTLPLPAPSRLELIAARDVIAGWSHAEIDDLLLEGGVHGLAAGRDAGSRKNRATAIVEFAIHHPEATTAENSLFSAFITRKAPVRSRKSSSRVANSHTTEAVSEVNANRAIHDSTSRSSNRVFIVHGHDSVSRDAVCSFLKTVGLEGIVLHEQPSMGRHLLTKFIEEADLVTFAIVLMTDDDEGRQKGGTLAPRARQNVILELGYFLSHLEQKRVCALVTPGLETPSDSDGIVYIPLDDGGNCKSILERELRAAKMPLPDAQPHTRGDL